MANLTREEILDRLQEEIDGCIRMVNEAQAQLDLAHARLRGLQDFQRRIAEEEAQP
jgi:hypothetical protein